MLSAAAQPRPARRPPRSQYPGLDAVVRDAGYLESAQARYVLQLSVHDWPQPSRLAAASTALDPAAGERLNRALLYPAQRLWETKPAD